MAIIVLIGLGPGDPALLTRAAAAALDEATAVYTSTPGHPALAHLPPALLHPLPAHAAAQHLTEQAARAGSVLCALPGSPSDHALTAQLGDGPVALRSIPGISIADTCRAALGDAGFGAGLQIIDADGLQRSAWEDLPGASRDPADAPWCEMQGLGPYVPPRLPYPLLPTRPALIITQYAAAAASPNADSAALRDRLLLRYPATHPLRLLQLDDGGQAVRVWEAALHDLAAEDSAGISAVYVPPLDVVADRRGLDGLEWVSARLLGPGGCPWDRRQTHQSLRYALLEEAYEVLEALDNGDMPAMAEELGDLLLSIVVHSEMARQGGHFALSDVLDHVTSKLIRRHPHVFGEVAVSGTGDVLTNWEQIKAAELAEKGRDRSSALDGIPAAIPALAAAEKMVWKAARAGFDWQTSEEVWAKLHEELDELREASEQNDPAHLSEEFGDVLFAAANVARWLQIDAETALREANAKFRRRFVRLEGLVRAQGNSMPAMSLDAKLALWREAKIEP